MALIRCPQCNTGHDLDDSLFLGGSRRVRCASCRTVWLADAAQPTEPDLGWDIDDSASPASPASSAPQGQDDIDALFDAPLTGPATAPASQDDIDNLFAEPPKPEPPRAAPPDPVTVPPAPSGPAEDPLEAAAERRSERRRKAAPAVPPPKPARTGSKASLTAMFAAASIGTLATLLIFRHEVANLAPWSETIYESIGLGTREVGLFFEDVQSRASHEDGRETLEVTGTIHNRTRQRQLIPLMRLAIRSENGREVYVWTATADQADIGPNDRVKFRRRLASPPAEAHSVEVRFVPKQDIVASVPSR